VADLGDAPDFYRARKGECRLRSRSSEIGGLPKITETKDEYLLDRQRKKVFSRKLNTLVDLSESNPAQNRIDLKRGSSIFLDCLTIEEEVEDVQIEAIELMSYDNESSKLSSPMSKTLSKKQLVVDEFSLDGEEKKYKRFESDVGRILKLDCGHHGREGR
jgi:hypothetical protein